MVLSIPNNSDRSSIKNFGSMGETNFVAPDLVHIQKESYNWLLKDGIKELFDELLINNDLLPIKIKQACDGQLLSKKAIIICDFIASMTDRSATANHAKVIKQKNL